MCMLFNDIFPYKKFVVFNSLNKITLAKSEKSPFSRSLIEKDATYVHMES